MSALSVQQWKNIINQVTKALNVQSDGMTNLLLLTTAAEDNLGEFDYQQGGPALGPFQMEPATFNDIFANYLKYRLMFSTAVQNFRENPSALPFPGELIGNPAFACAMACVEYIRNHVMMPADSNDIYALAQQWVTAYNRGGKATVERGVEAWNEFVAPQLEQMT